MKLGTDALGLFYKGWQPRKDCIWNNDRKVRGSFSHDLGKKGVTVWGKKICSHILTPLLWFVTMWTEAFLSYTWLQAREKWHLLTRGYDQVQCLIPGLIFRGFPPDLRICYRCHRWSSKDSRRLDIHFWLMAIEFPYHLQLVCVLLVVFLYLQTNPWPLLMLFPWYQTNIKY